MKRADKSTDGDFEIVEFMTEFARFLVAAGIARTRFARIVEFAYFQAASQEARFQNHRLNQSAVAAMTGLTRNQVRMMLKQKKVGSNAPIDRIDRIITAWTSDAEYMTATLAPRRLRIVGKAPSFQTLVLKVGGDIPHRSILRELERLRLVAVDGGYVKLTKVARGGLEGRSLRQLSRALARVIQCTGEAAKIDSPMRAVTMEISYPAQSGAGRILMQRRLSKSLRAFMADVEAAGAAAALESPPRAKSERRRMSQARFLMITNEKEK